MQIQNIKIFDSTVAADGIWCDVGNLVNLSVHVVNLEGKVWIEVSNDPNVKNDGSTISAPSAPTLSQFVYGVLTGQPTYSVRLTYVVNGGGETTQGAAASLTVSDLNLLRVASPIADAAGVAVAYNVYISINGDPYQLQNTGNNSQGNQGYSGPIPLGKPFILAAFNASGVVPPSGNSASSPGVGVNVLGTAGSPPVAGNLVGLATALDQNPIVSSDSNNGGQAALAFSSITWKWLRVRKDNTAQTKETTAYLCGAQG